jgi:hypothetical protein
MTVELVYDKNCPNVAQARANLLRALSETRSLARWTEWERSDLDAPQHIRQFGSPTVLVESMDVAGLRPLENADCCRIYPSADGRQVGVPGVNLIARALRKMQKPEPEKRRPGSGSQTWLVLPGVVVSILPNLACPACWPAYASLLPAAAIGFLGSSFYLLPLTFVFLAIAIAALARKAHRPKSCGPLLLGVAAPAATLMGRFSVASDPLRYTGAGVLVAASLWSSMAERKRCGSCIRRSADNLALKTRGKREEKHECQKKD